MYAGEYFDSDSQNYYNRARWYNPLTGLFNRVDPFDGSLRDPQSLHKYLYCLANPVMYSDPSGLFSMAEVISVNSIMAIAIGSLAPALLYGYEQAKAGASILEIIKSAAMMWGISFSIGIGLAIAAPYLMAAAVWALSLIPGVSAGMAAAAIGIVFLGLTIYGGYELWTSDYPLWLKISVTAILAVSVVVALGRDGIKQIAAKAKDIIKGLRGKPPARQVTNPWGRPGGPSHRARIDQAEQRFRDKGWETFSGGSKPEKRVYMPDGSYRYPDLVMQKGDIKVAFNVGHATKSGLPVSGERPALADLREAGTLAHAFFLKF